MFDLLNIFNGLERDLSSHKHKKKKRKTGLSMDQSRTKHGTSMVDSFSQISRDPRGIEL